MVPDAKLLHPYIGFSGYHGHPTFQTKNNPAYSQNFCNLFTDSPRVFKHDVKMFFPEIKHGVLAVDRVKYSHDSHADDDVKVEAKVIADGKYEEYFVIKDFIAEFTIEISVDFGHRGSITHPVEVFCDFIDVYVQNQLISLTVHDNNLLFVPYVMSYKSDFPPEVARIDSSSTNIVVNTDLSYGFILNESSKAKMEEKGFTSAAVDMVLLDTKKMVENTIEVEAGNSEDFGIPLDEVMNSYGGVSPKYILLLPQAIFPDRMSLYGLPIFNSEINMECCKYKKAGWCTPYFGIYGIPYISGECVPDMCLDEKCMDTPQYEVRNKVIDGYIILAEKPWDELDRLAGVLSVDKKARELAKQNITIEGE
jgi:hypothetical protein